MNKEILGLQEITFESSESIHLKDNSIDTIITSPPYNRNKTYSDDSGNEYNDNLPEDDYINFLKRVWSECLRVLKPTGVFFLNIGDSANDQGKSEDVVKSAEEIGFIRLQTIVWIKSILGKGHYTPSGGDKRLNNVWENIFVLVKDKKHYAIYPKDIGVPYSDKSNIGRYNDQDLRDAGNVWFIPYSKTTGKNVKKGHDAPFPIELAIKCIKLVRARSVLDPFLGTGSTLAAAHVCGIRGYGYEKYPRKGIIKERILTANSLILNNLDHLQIAELEQTIEYLLTLVERYNKKINVKDIVRSSKKEENLISILKKVVNHNSLNLDFINELDKDKSKIRSIEEFMNK